MYYTYASGLCIYGDVFGVFRVHWKLDAAQRLLRSTDIIITCVCVCAFGRERDVHLCVQRWPSTPASIICGIRQHLCRTHVYTRMRAKQFAMFMLAHCTTTGGAPDNICQCICRMQRLHDGGAPAHCARRFMLCTCMQIFTTISHAFALWAISFSLSHVRWTVWSQQRFI